MHPNAHLSSPRAARAAARARELTGNTAGVAYGHVQGNVAILPREHAGEFERFCQRNPKPCPVLAIGDPGDPHLPTLGADVDIRTDCPRYRVFEHGECVDEPHDLGRWWRDDLVAFILGCSFSFEQALLEAGVPLRHIEQGRNVAMWRTNMPTVPAGRFHGPLVVSMRPFKAADAIRAIQITSRFPNVHGAPVHIGLPEVIGIRDLAQPDWGDAVEVKPQKLAAMVAGLPLPPWAIMLLIVGFYLALGTFMEGFSMIITTIPVIFPIVKALGYDPIWFGVIITMLVEIALISPPDGTVLYVLQGMRPDRGSITDVFWGVLPFLAVYILAIGLLMFSPQIALWLPSVAMR